MVSLGLALVYVVLLSLPVRAYEEIAVQNGGNVRGSVKIEGVPDELPPLDVYKFKQICGHVPNESLIVGLDQGVRYGVVTLEGVNKGKAIEREVAHELDNRGCRFVPHVQAASVGQFVVTKNTDPILHTAHAYFEAGGQPQFNVGLYPGRISRKPLVTPGVVKVTCDVHPWMKAYTVVTEHPYHAVTDALGEYEIRDIPPGTYRLKLWHESLGTEEKTVEVKGGAVTKVNFTLSSPQGVKQ